LLTGELPFTLPAGPQHANPMGTFHGGILCDIADAAVGMALASTLAAEESFTTVELKINFFRPEWRTRLKAEGTVVQRGGTIGYMECSVTDEENPADRESSIHWHGPARPEGHRTLVSPPAITSPLFWDLALRTLPATKKQQLQDC
jgi:uncharacterized protein (TIGR00369 family)